MKIAPEIQSILLHAEAKALATFANDDVNVVPVSSVKIVDDKIWLINYFFEKTISNIIENPKVALTFWIGLRGYQVKAHVNYVTDGNDYDAAVSWIAEMHPNRMVKGLLVLTVTDVFDISIHNKRI